MKKIAIINGPNLNLLGVREPTIYGNQTFESYFKTLLNQYRYKADLIYFQSNHEGLLIDKIQEFGFDFDGIILNAGAYTHTSIAIRDAIKAIRTPVIEVHISNIYNREDFRKINFLKEVCSDSFIGIGLKGYSKAIQKIIEN